MRTQHKAVNIYVNTNGHCYSSENILLNGSEERWQDMEKHFLHLLSRLIQQNRKAIFSPRPKSISPMTYLDADGIACLPTKADYRKQAKWL
jgi:hypothetical protein